MKSKHIFEDQADALADEVKRYKAHAEAKTIEKKDCRHKSVKLSEGKLICQCGAVWQGPGLHNLLTELNSA